MNLVKPIWASAACAALFVAAACGGSAAVTPEAPSGPSGAPTSGTSSTPTLPPAATPSAALTAAATPSAGVDLSALDACSLLDEQTVQDLTGTSYDFTTGASGRPDCFWGATTAVPPYVEISVFARPDGLSGYAFNAGECSSVPVAGIGSEAVGGTCTISTQHKVYLIGWDQGVAVRVLVNEPERTLEPEDIGATIEALLAQIN